MDSGLSQENVHCGVICQFNLISFSAWQRKSPASPQDSSLERSQTHYANSHEGISTKRILGTSAGKPVKSKLLESILGRYEVDFIAQIMVPAAAS